MDVNNFDLGLKKMLYLVRKFYSATVISFLMISVRATADTAAIIGGIDLTGGPPYAALVSSSGQLIPLACGDPTATSGIIQSVSMNFAGISLIGGQQSLSSTTPAYAAFVSSSGEITPLPIAGLPAMHGIIYSVAINNFGSGIIGGQDLDGPIYAALVPPSGNSLTVLEFPSLVAAGGVVRSVAINDSGNSLLGGQVLSGDLPSFAASVSPSGDMTPLNLTGGISVSGVISSVAINGSGKGLIGGQNLDLSEMQPAYAAFVTSNSVTPFTLTGGGIATTGEIASVGINDSGNGIVGGQDLVDPQPGYAALVSSSGDVIPLQLTGGIATTGVINSVAINSSGNGIIGGQDYFSPSQPAYAALVSSSGTVTPLVLGSDMDSNGIIYSVAINSSGNGIVGGWDLVGSQAYAALFTSSGSVIPITFTGGISMSGFINSVALPLSIRIPTASLSGNNLIFAEYINEFAPDNAFYFILSVLDGTLNAALQSAAPTRNGISTYIASNNLFFLMTSFANCIRNQQQLAQQNPSIAVTQNALPYDELLTSLTLQKKATPQSQDKPFTIWFEAIGAWAHQKAQHQTVGVDPATGGAILACDRLITPRWRVGGGAAYLFTHIHEKDNQGHSNINQEEVFIYGSWDNQKFYVDMLVMGGALQIDQVRKIAMTGFSFRSTSHPNGWQLLPHLELGYKANIFNPSKMRKFCFNPFVMLDWANAWQERYKEKGDGPFNAAQKSYYGSLLRTEAGLRFYETFFFNRWNFTIQEKISYVNTQSFNAGKVNAFLVGSPGAFTVETLSSAQNLGVAQLAMTFDPLRSCFPKTTFFYQGEFGSKYQSHQLNIELAWQF